MGNVISLHPGFSRSRHNTNMRETGAWPTILCRSGEARRDEENRRACKSYERLRYNRKHYEFVGLRK
jgi:hypothetical protein